MPRGIGYKRGRTGGKNVHSAHGLWKAKGRRKRMGSRTHSRGSGKIVKDRRSTNRPIY